MAFNNEEEKKLDHLCYGAISILEMLGNYKPSQVQIDMASTLLMHIFFNYMSYFMNPQNTLQVSQQMEVNQFIDYLAKESDV